MAKARTLQDIIDHPLVESTHVENDGCFTDSLGRELPGRWVYLKAGYVVPRNECGTIHESSIKACCEQLNEARLVTRQEVIDGYVTSITLEQYEALKAEDLQRRTNERALEDDWDARTEPHLTF